VVHDPLVAWVEARFISEFRVKILVKLVKLLGGRMKTAIAVVVALAATLFVLGCFLFHGYFDPGKFEIKQVRWSSSQHVAMVAERSDKEALGGLTYFVLIGNHVFSPVELRHAYHSDAPVFAATATCLKVHWDGPSKLVVERNGSYLDQQHIDVEKRQSGEAAISYVDISPDTAQTFRPK